MRDVGRKIIKHTSLIFTVSCPGGYQSNNSALNLKDFKQYLLFSKSKHSYSNIFFIHLFTQNSSANNLFCMLQSIFISSSNINAMY